MTVLRRRKEFPAGHQNYSLGRPITLFFEDFMNPVEAPTTNTHNLISIIFKIPQASPKADVQSKMGAVLIQRAGNAKTEEYLMGGKFLYGGESRK